MTDFPTIEPAWIWPDKISRWFRTRATGHTLHVCSGTSNIGDITIDRDPTNNPDLVADMRHLPFPDAHFDTSIWDPPWKGPFSRHKPYHELCRVTKPNGTILWNTTWIPTSDQTQHEDIAVRQDDDGGKISILGQSRRYANQTTIDAVTDGGDTGRNAAWVETREVPYR